MRFCFSQQFTEHCKHTIKHIPINVRAGGTVPARAGWCRGGWERVVGRHNRVVCFVWGWGRSSGGLDLGW